MRIGRTLPPAAAPIYLRDVLSGIKGLFKGEQEIDRFESELKDYFGVKYCFLVSSGKAALSIILQALKDIQPEKDEVLIPAFTCYSVPSAIVNAGLKVKLCDINPNTLDFDFDQLRTILSEYRANTKPKKPNEPMSRLLCIIPTHLFGIPADIERIRKLLVDPEVTIVEDAAQAMGGKWNGQKLGTLGDVSFFSLGRGKAFSTVEGGIILTNRNNLANKIMARIEAIPRYNSIDLIMLFLKAISLTFFLRPACFWLPKSIPILKLGETIYDTHFKTTKMSAFQAGLAKTWQNKLMEFIRTRGENSMEWTSIVRTNNLHHFTSINGSQSDVIRFPVRVDDGELREEILMRSNRMGLGIMPTYPDSIDRILELRDNFQAQNFPEAKKHAENLITLPTHSFVTQRDREKIKVLISKNSH